MPEEPEPDNSHLSMMERRPWTRRLNRRLPRRFRDELPQALPSLLPDGVPQPTPLNTPPPFASAMREAIPLLARRVGSHICRTFKTPRNIFGLSRLFYGREMPSDDTEAEITLQDLSNISVDRDPLNSTPPTFYPFPHRSAFAMGDWFWNGGVQKSLRSFRELMDILSDPEFNLEDVQGVNWDQVNNLLAMDDEGEWVDEDAGWMRTPVTISVPYQSRRGQPSDPNAAPRNFMIDDFYHRPLVSIIREKISAKDCRLFHTEPYEMYWEPTHLHAPVRVQGELYTSPAFMDAHRELQDSPGEPGCDLPRVIVALMFWSDATQLTSFGNAKLWPLYLFFGNESKYHRCKPSCNLCEHVAYFQSVSFIRTF